MQMSRASQPDLIDLRDTVIGLLHSRIQSFVASKRGTMGSCNEREGEDYSYS